MTDSDSFEQQLPQVLPFSSTSLLLPYQFLVSECLRFWNLRTPHIYAKAVFKVISSAESQLQRDEPTRQSFLKLIKEICDYISSKKSAAGENANAK